MSKAVKVDGATYYVKCNWQTRELLSIAELPTGVFESEFSYIGTVTDDDMYTPRFFNYRGSWYDTAEFETAPTRIKALGFDGYQTESYFSAVGLAYFDRDGYEFDGAVIVGYVHW